MAANASDTRLVLLPEMPLHRILGFLPGESLALSEPACHSVRAGVTADLWRALVLSHWGWLVQRPGRRAWKEMFVCLRTQRNARFCVIGGIEEIVTLDGVPLSLHIERSTARQYSLEHGSWSCMSPPRDMRHMPAVVRDAAGALVVMGGTAPPTEEQVGFATLASVERYEDADQEWSSMPSMNCARCCCSAALDGQGNIYVVGGGDSMYAGAECLSSVERYAPGEEHWFAAPTMNQPRCAVGVAVSYSTAALFAFGGYAGSKLYLDTCEKLDVGDGSDGRWQMLPPMSCKRAGTNAAAGPDGRVFVLGGGPDGRSEWDTMEALDPRDGVWNTSLARLQLGRHYNAAAFGPDGLLYVSGTFRHDGQLDVVERYDPRADQWEELDPVGAVVKFSAGVFVF